MFTDIKFLVNLNSNNNVAEIKSNSENQEKFYFNFNIASNKPQKITKS